MTNRWSEPVTTSTTFTTEQRRRVQALRAAREVLETRTPGTGPFTSAGVELSHGYLIDLAQWIIDESNPLITDRVVERMLPVGES